MFWGILSAFCYNNLICYVTLLYMLINKFTTGFSGDKVPRTLVVLKMEIQFRKKNGTKVVIFISLKIFPKAAKMLHVLQCEFFLKAAR